MVITKQERLALHHADGPLMTGLGTQAAAVALLSVDLNDSTNHVIFRLSLTWMG